MDDRSDRIEELRRAAYVKRVSPAWLRRLREATGIALTTDELITHSETVALKSAYYETLAQLTRSAKRNWPIAEWHVLANQLAGICSIASDTEVVVFHSEDEQLGAFRLRAIVALKIPFELWKVLGEDLRLMTSDCESGLCLGLEQYSLNAEFYSEGIYEYAGWGCFRLAARADGA